jgi:hypothetical protein
MTSASGLAGTQVTIEDIFGKGDRVAVRCTFRGIYRGAPKPGYLQPGERCTIVPITASSTARSRTIGEYKRFGTAVCRGSESESFPRTRQSTFLLRLTCKTQQR